MKAKRRHDLQTNTLAKVITNAPTWWSEHGTKTLMILIGALLVGFLIRYRINSSRETAAHAAQELASARGMIGELHDRYQPFSGIPPEQLLIGRRQLSAEASASIENAINDASDPHIKAEGLIARGDLNWLLATFPDLPGAATQPALRMGKNRDELMSLAAESYQSVLDNYGKETNAVIAAHFGLAAIAEDRGEWDAAAKHYDAVVDNSEATAAYKTLAGQRKGALEAIKRPALIVPPATTRAATMPVGAAAPTTKTSAVIGPVMSATTRAATTQH